MRPIYVEHFFQFEDWEPNLGPFSVQALQQECEGLPWELRSAARYECFLADRKIEYAYGARQNRSYVSGPLTPQIRLCTEKVNRELSMMGDLFVDEGAWGPMNGCFLNRYDDKRQALGWHADDFEGMDHTKAVAVVSLGQEREIWWRKKGEKGVVPPEQRQLLAHGSLFVMPPGFQHTHDHRIPKVDRDVQRRVSLTFRAFKEETS